MEFLVISEVTSELLMSIAIGAIVLGIIFGLIEMCMPGFGIFGSLGGFFCLAGVILHIVAGGNLIISILILVMTSVFFTALFLIIGRSARKGRLSKTALVATETAVPTGATSATPNFSTYVGKIGETITDLRPVGKAKFDGEIIEVISCGSAIITKGETVEITFVEGGKVNVSKAD